MTKSKTSLFLMELIIVILFFSIASAVCVQLFFKAHEIDVSTDKLSHSNIVIQNLAECFYGTDGRLNEIKNAYSGSECDSNVLYVSFDEEWNIVSFDNDRCTYVAKLTSYDNEKIESNSESSSGILLNANISVYDVDNSIKSVETISESELIASQDITHYIQYRKGAY